MYTSNRDVYRLAFFSAWEKHLKHQLLEPIEAQLVAIILEHPEYHSFLQKADGAKEFNPEDNPFIHMSLHLAIREQINTNRPKGIVQIHSQLLKRYRDRHAVEHHMMACLVDMMWSSQQNGIMPNEELYLRRLSNGKGSNDL